MESSEASIRPNEVAPWFSDVSLVGLRDYWRVYRDQHQAINEALMPLVLGHPTFGPMIRAMPKEVLEAQNRESLERSRRAIEEGAWGPYVERLRKDGAMYAQLGVAFREWYDLVGIVNRELVPRLVAAYRDNPTQMVNALRAMQELTDRAMAIIAETYIETKEKALRESEARLAEAAALRLAKEAAEEANGELESFSYSIAHDLRAPLRGISGFSSAVLEDYGDKMPREGQDYLRRIVANAEQMGKTIDALLGLARVTRTELCREGVDLTAMARSVLSQIRVAEPNRAVDVVVHEGMIVEADASLVRALLENLLGNAWKFSGKRSLARIEVGLSEVDGIRAYFVRDNGAGFDMTYVDRLFAPFKRLHSAKEFAGTGIGLATVQRIVRRHGGRIWAEGVEGEGATFWFTLYEVAKAGEAR